MDEFWISSFPDPKTDGAYNVRYCVSYFVLLSSLPFQCLRNNHHYDDKIQNQCNVSLPLNRSSLPSTSSSTRSGQRPLTSAPTTNTNIPSQEDHVNQRLAKLCLKRMTTYYQQLIQCIACIFIFFILHRTCQNNNARLFITLSI